MKRNENSGRLLGTAILRLEDSELLKAQDLFILEWERMSSSWGINRTMAQIHALLFVTGKAMDVNEIMMRLAISRGNASMNLRELLDWGVVRRARRAGDRKDTFVTETDPWQMFIRVIRERKRREIDPTIDAMREVLSKIPQGSQDEEAVALQARISGLLEIFELFDSAYRQIFRNDESINEFRDLLRMGKSEGETSR